MRVAGPAHPTKKLQLLAEECVQRLERAVEALLARLADLRRRE